MDSMEVEVRDVGAAAAVAATATVVGPPAEPGREAAPLVAAAPQAVAAFLGSWAVTETVAAKVATAEVADRAGGASEAGMRMNLKGLRSQAAVVAR
eukprot:3136674-Prymnesium_polylepis.1